LKVKSVKLNLAILALLILGGCASNNKFASRKYTKGYYVDFVSKQKAESGITRNETNTIQTPIAVKPELPSNTIPIASSKIASVTAKTHPPAGGKLHSLMPVLLNKQNVANTTKLVEKPLFTDAIAVAQTPSDDTEKSPQYGKVAFPMSLIGSIFLIISSVAILLSPMGMFLLILALALCAAGMIIGLCGLIDGREKSETLDILAVFMPLVALAIGFFLLMLILKSIL
jgi:hypothetical protein